MATLKAENAILHEVLQCSLPHLDPTAQCLVSTVAGTLRQSCQTSSGVGRTTVAGTALTSADLEAGVQGRDRTTRKLEEAGARDCDMPDSRSSHCEQNSRSPPEELDMLTTLRHVLGEECENQSAEKVASAQPPAYTSNGDDAASVSGSDWSGDDVVEAAGHTLRASMSNPLDALTTMQSCTEGQPQRVASTQQAVMSVAGVSSVGFALPQSVTGTEESTQAEDEHPEPLRLARPGRHKRRGKKARRDTMDLSRVPRMAAQLRAPMHANSAVSFLQKLVNTRADGDLQAPPVQGLGTAAEGCNEQVAVLGVQDIMQPDNAASMGASGDGDGGEMDKAKAVILAAVQRRKQGKGAVAATGPDGASQGSSSTEAGLAAAEIDVAKSDQHQHGAAGDSGVDMGTRLAEQPLCTVSEERVDTVNAAPDGHACEEDTVAENEAQPSGGGSMLMPDVHATSVAVASALRSIGSARARDQSTSRPPFAWSSSLRSLSPRHSPAQGPAPQGNTTVKPWLMSARLGSGRTSPTRSRSLSPRHVPSGKQATGRQKDAVIEELQAQTHTMANIMNEHMPWMINEVPLSSPSSIVCS